MTRSEALKLRLIIEQAVQSLTDETAVEAVTLYPTWAVSTAYTVEHKVRDGDKLYKCRTPHTSILGWEPANAPTLWTCINESHTGSIDEPIPYDGNMVLENSLYYIQNGITYLCIRDTVNPVYHNLSDLVGLYVEVV